MDRAVRFLVMTVGYHVMAAFVAVVFTVAWLLV